MNKIKMDGFTRISKQEARKRFDTKQTIFLVPCKMIPGNPWGMTMKYDATNIQHRMDEVMSDNPFESLCSDYAYYNCQYNETGKYIAFYKRDED